jgi:hypothetical protein
MRTSEVRGEGHLGDLGVGDEPLFVLVPDGVRVLDRGPRCTHTRSATTDADSAKACGAGGFVTVRADSAYYGHGVVAAARRGAAGLCHRSMPTSA